MDKPPDGSWLPGIVISFQIDQDRSVFCILTEETTPRQLTVETKAVDKFNFEYEWIKRRESESYDCSKILDMTNLTQLNEPEIISCLLQRYQSNLIYTSTGPILLAINPCKELPIYDIDIVDYYCDAAINSASHHLSPHVFQISANAYNRMLTHKFDAEARENQSILVNGESGAGNFLFHSNEFAHLI